MTLDNDASTYVTSAGAVGRSRVRRRRSCSPLSRRPSSSLPWALDGDRADATTQPRAADTRLAEQPLTGLGGGVTVREVSQATPFSMVALTGDDLTGTSARIRAKHADGSWGPWYEAETLRIQRQRRPPPADARTARHRSGLRRHHHAVQIAVTRPADAPVTTPHRPRLTENAGLGYRPPTPNSLWGRTSPRS